MSDNKTTNQSGEASNSARPSATPAELAALRGGMTVGIQEHNRTFGDFKEDQTDYSDLDNQIEPNSLPPILRPVPVERGIVINAMKMMKVPSFTVDRWGVREESSDYWRGALEMINLLKIEEDKRNEMSIDTISNIIGPMSSVVNDLKNEVLAIKAKIGGPSGADDKILKDLREIKDLIITKPKVPQTYQSAHVELINDRDVKPDIAITVKPESVLVPGAIQEMEKHMKTHQVPGEKIKMVSAVIKSHMYLPGGQGMFQKIINSEKPMDYIDYKWNVIETKYKKLVATGQIS